MYRLVVRKPVLESHLGRQIIDGRIISKQKIKIQDIGTWTDLSEL